MSINYEINRLLNFGIQKGLIEDVDKIYSANRIIGIIKLCEFYEEIVNEELSVPFQPLNSIIDYAVSKQIVEDTFTSRELFDSLIMDCLTPRPNEINKKFYELYNIKKKSATDYFYNLSIATNYIKSDRIKNNIKYYIQTEYGKLEITINLSKPEKDPREIEKAKLMKVCSYPKCLLCKENEGFYGDIKRPARENHRLISLKLCNKSYYMQYSPYTYYNEHCIILNKEHVPMKINKETFENLLDFVTQFPHYFLGSNADLPIVGGSILSHDHYQGGNHNFAMEKAKVEKEYRIEEYEDINVGRVKWPMSVIRLKGIEKKTIVKLAEKILNKWKQYSDETVDILAYSDNISHNTITPIARFNGVEYELDLVLRNNRCNKENPLGIFHPHDDVHHIKKENIGIIEVMGLAVLPPRLKEELNYMAKSLENNIQEIEGIHRDFYREIKTKYGKVDFETANDIVKREIGKAFIDVLSHAGVYKWDEEGKKAFDKFMESLNK